MSIEAARKAVEFLERNVVSDDVGDPHFGQSGVKAYPLVKDGFQQISERKSKRKIAFVDGGNKEVIGAPNFSVQLNRVYSMAWCEKNRDEWKLPRVEFFSSTYSCFKKDDIYYETSVIASDREFEQYIPDPADLSFCSNDRTLTSGNQRADIERVGSVARKFGEWRVGLATLGKLSEGDVLVMDGSLQSGFTNEVKYVQALSRAAKDRGVILTGLSKTSTIFTTTGLSLIGAVSGLAEKEKIGGSWYFPVAESHSIDHDVIVTVSRLHPVSERAFRFEIQREEYERLGKEGREEVFTLLCLNSCDATFPGYPYGLIDADRFARVSYDEIEYYRALIMSQMKSPKFLPHIRSRDAHDILNLQVR